jgi:hypothetical protein
MDKQTYLKTQNKQKRTGETYPGCTRCEKIIQVLLKCIILMEKTTQKRFYLIVKTVML